LAAEAGFNGAVLLTSGDYDEVLKARDGVYKSQTAKDLLAKKLVSERSLFWVDRETNLRCKARPDLVTKDHIIVDVKTTQSAHPGSFMRDVLKYHYHIQEAHYVDGAFATNDGKFEVHGFVFLCIEKKEPFACAVYRLDAATVREGLNLRNKALQLYKQCHETNSWPSYPEGIQELRIPAFGFETIDLGEFDAISA
jgi:exodeoxyribonuclease VIII